MELKIGQKFKDLGNHIVYLKSHKESEFYPDRTDLDSWEFASETNGKDWNFVYESTEGIKKLIQENELRPMENETPNSDVELVAQIEAKIKAACVDSKYTHLCQRVESEGGMIYVINRCIQMMSSDNIHLSTALANLESEFEGVS